MLLIDRDGALRIRSISGSFGVTISFFPNSISNRLLLQPIIMMELRGNEKFTGSPGLAEVEEIIGYDDNAEQSLSEAVKIELETIVDGEPHKPEESDHAKEMGNEKTELEDVNDQETVEAPPATDIFCGVDEITCYDVIAEQSLSEAVAMEAETIVYAEPHKSEDSYKPKKKEEQTKMKDVIEEETIEAPLATDFFCGVDEITCYDVIAEQSLSEAITMEPETIVYAEPHKLEDSDKPKKKEKKQTEMEDVIVQQTVEAPLITDIFDGEKLEDGDKTEETRSADKVESCSKETVERQTALKKTTGAGTSAVKAADEPEDADLEKTGLKIAQGVGLLFLCNDNTWKECFEYKIFGLPGNKKELVAKIYKGMKLFLYNTDKKMMYGIFKATSPGGYHIQPKAFNSRFPSQVRFALIENCIPLPEEKFKAAIKSNYYGRNKFNIELSREQVRDLCRLFRNETKRKNMVVSIAPISAGLEQAIKAPSSDGLGRNTRAHPQYFPTGVTYRRESSAIKAPKPGGLGRNTWAHPPYLPTGVTYRRESSAIKTPKPGGIGRNTWAHPPYFPTGEIYRRKSSALIAAQLPRHVPALAPPYFPWLHPIFLPMDIAIENANEW